MNLRHVMSERAKRATANPVHDARILRDTGTPYRTPPRYLILLVTNACNLKCSYCYRGNPRGLPAMSRDIAWRAILLASSCGKPFHVQISGGEPLLEIELVHWIALVIRQAGFPVTIGLQTNGTMMDLDTAKKFRELGIQIGISLDGPKDVHNFLRGNFNNTLYCMKILNEIGMDFRVTAVVTRDNVLFLDKLVLLLSAFPACRGLALDILVNKGRAKGSLVPVAPPDEQALKAGISRLYDALLYVNERRSVALTLRELENIRRPASRAKAAVYCHACIGESLAVLPDGSLFPCSQTAGDMDFYLGNLHELQPETLSGRSLTGLEAKGIWCEYCPLEGRCPGDCPSRLYYNGRGHKGLTCVMYQALWEAEQRRQG